MQCSDTPFGCCKDGFMPAKGPNNAGCPGKALNSALENILVP